MLTQALLSDAFEAAVGQLLALDLARERWLTPLAGKVIGVRLEPPGVEFFFSPTSRSVLILETYEEPDTRLIGSPLAFLRMVTSSSPTSELFAGAIRIEGDMDVARQFQNLLQHLDLDWEGWLARWTGEAAARQTGDWMRSFSRWHRHAWQAFQENLAEYLQEETRALPAPLEAENLYRQIGELRDDVARLEARWARLREKLCL